MSKAKLIDDIATRLGSSKKDAQAALDAVTDSIASIAKSENKIIIPGFGKFTYTLTPGRQGRNPATGETMQIAEKWQLKFKEAKAS